MARRSPRDWGTVRKLPSGRYQAQTAPDPLTGSRIPLGTYRTRADATRALRPPAEKRAQSALVPPPGTGGALQRVGRLPGKSLVERVHRRGLRDGRLDLWSQESRRRR